MRVSSDARICSSNTPNPGGSAHHIRRFTGELTSRTYAHGSSAQVCAPHAGVGAEKAFRAHTRLIDTSATRTQSFEMQSQQACKCTLQERTDLLLDGRRLHSYALEFVLMARALRLRLLVHGVHANGPLVLRLCGIAAKACASVNATYRDKARTSPHGAVESCEHTPCTMHAPMRILAGRSHPGWEGVTCIPKTSLP